MFVGSGRAPHLPELIVIQALTFYVAKNFGLVKSPWIDGNERHFPHGRSFAAIVDSSRASNLQENRGARIGALRTFLSKGLATQTTRCQQGNDH